jgi:hypothetical protein
MTRAITRDSIYRRRRLQPEIIELCVRLYITYGLSYRDLVAMMAERGVDVSHTTILRWVLGYVPEFEKRWARYGGSPAAGCSTRVRTAFPDWDDSGRMAEPARDRGFVAAAYRYLQVVG